MHVRFRPSTEGSSSVVLDLDAARVALTLTLMSATSEQADGAERSLCLMAGSPGALGRRMARALDELRVVSDDDAMIMDDVSTMIDADLNLGPWLHRFR